MLKLNFHHLYYFYRIAEAGQFAGAAKRLRIGQPTLSTQLKQFEDHLGYRLFDRKRGQTLGLTRKGKILHRYAREIFRLADEMLAAARGMEPDRTFHLQIGALDWLPKREISDLMAAVTSRFDCFVSVHEDSSAALLKKLTRNELDLIVTNSPAAHSATRPLVARRIARLPLVIYGAPRFAGLQGEFPRSLEGQPIILPTRHGTTRQIIEDYFTAERIPVKVVGEAQDGELLRRTALSGKALVPLSPSTVETEVQRGDLIAIGKLSRVYEEIWIIGTRRLSPHPAVAYLMNRFGKSSSAR